MTVKEARKLTGWTQQRLSDELRIPKRTIEDWEGERRKCPEWVERLVVREILRKAKVTHVKAMTLYYVQTNSNPFVLADDGENRYTITSEDMLIPRIDLEADELHAAAAEILGNIWQVGESDGWDKTSATVEELLEGNTVLATLDTEI